MDRKWYISLGMFYDHYRHFILPSRLYPMVAGLGKRQRSIDVARGLAPPFFSADATFVWMAIRAIRCVIRKEAGGELTSSDPFPI